MTNPRKLYEIYLIAVSDDTAVVPISSQSLQALAIESPGLALTNAIDWTIHDPDDLHYKAFHIVMEDHTDPYDLTIDYIHPCTFAAKSASPDTYNFWQYLRMNDVERESWDKAMDKEMNELFDKSTFKLV
jgi:hypothetical protein